MTSTSYLAWARWASDGALWKRRIIPAATSFSNQLASVSPSGTGNRGMRSRCSKLTSQRSAMSSVLSHASGWSRKRWRICAADLR
jgi:hypothetical protein